jgi:hypothetical protein
MVQPHILHINRNFKWSNRRTMLSCDYYLSYIYLGYFVCVSVIHNCGTLRYSLCFNDQTDQGDETEGLKREGLKGER